MDEVKDKVEEILKKIKKDKKFASKFKKDPVKAVEDVLGIDLPDEMINKVIDAVKTKITLDKADDAMDKVKDLFGKK